MNNVATVFKSTVPMNQDSPAIPTDAKIVYIPYPATPSFSPDQFQGRALATQSESDKFSRISSALGQFAAGGMAGFLAASNTVVGEADGGLMSQLTGSLGDLAGSSLYGAGIGAAIGGVVSGISNGIGVAQGKVTTGTAVKRVLGDTLSAAVGGLAGTFTGGLGALAMNSFGLGGLPLVIGSVVLGGLGSLAAGKLVRPLVDKFAQ